MRSTNFVLGFLAIAIFSACSPRIETPPQRFFGGEVQLETGLDAHAIEASAGACARLQLLASDTATPERFSLFREVRVEQTPTGAVSVKAALSVTELPFLQVLATSQRLRSQIELNDEDFFDVAKLEMKIGTCDLANAATWGFACRGLWARTVGPQGCDVAALNPVCEQGWLQVLERAQIGICRHVENGPADPEDKICVAAKQRFTMLNFLRQQNRLFMAKNKSLEERLPGIFGVSGEATTSILAPLFRRLLANAGSDSSGLVRILTAETPMFLPQGWSAWRQDAELSAAALREAFASEQPAERVCGLVLAHRTFNQLLSLNGHLRPDLENGHVQPLSKDRNSLGVNPVPGVYRKLQGDQWLPTIVSPQDLATYDPAQGLLMGGKALPGSENLSAGLEGLTDRLERLLGLEIIFELLSPAAKWMGPAVQAYPLGDFEAGTGILPLEAGGLALGHLALNFKNLAAINLKQVKADGALVQSAADQAAGVVLVETLSQTLEGEMSLEQLGSLARFVARFDAAIDRLLRADPAVVASLNPTLNAPALTALRATQQRLRHLKLPLLIAIGKMTDVTLVPGGRSLCVSRALVRLAPGLSANERIRPLGFCTPGLVEQVASARRLLEASVFQAPR